VRSYAVRLSLVVLALSGCISAFDLSAPPSNVDGSGFLAIQTTKPVYSWNDDSSGFLLTVEATIRNSSNRSFYARIGDAFNSSIDQEQLFVAQGSDGAIEKQLAATSWAVVESGILIEGVKVIAIRAGETYELFGLVAGARSTGTFRIRLDYADRPEGEPGRQTYRDYSNEFVIR